jgi:predicted ester cyclase
MTINNTSEAAKAVVRRNTEEVQGGGNFEELRPFRQSVSHRHERELTMFIRDVAADPHSSVIAANHGTHRGGFLGVAPTGRKIQFETVDVMRVRNGKITEHWGVANLFSLMQQLGAWPAKQDRAD